jgi:hypothetical protein
MCYGRLVCCRKSTSKADKPDYYGDEHGSTLQKPVSAAGAIESSVSDETDDQNGD